MCFVKKIKIDNEALKESKCLMSGVQGFNYQRFQKQRIVKGQINQFFLLQKSRKHNGYPYLQNATI